MSKHINIAKAQGGPRDGQWIGYCSDSDTQEHFDLTLPDKYTAALDEIAALVGSSADGDEVVQARRVLAAAEKKRHERQAAEAKKAEAEAELAKARARLNQ